MSIRVTYIPEEFDLMSIHIIGAESIESFKSFIRRGANTDEKASPEIKEFIDLVTEGKILQNYWVQGFRSETPQKKD